MYKSFIAAALALTALGPGTVLAVGVDRNSITTPDNDGFINDGGDDALDGGQLLVNGSAYAGGSTGAVPNFVNGVQALGDITVSGRTDLLVPNGTTAANTQTPGLADFVYVRQFYSFTNTGDAPLVAGVDYELNLGSDFNTVTHATSSGDATIAAGDIWTVTDDAQDGGQADDGGSNVDPAVGLLVADGLAQLPIDLLERNPAGTSPTPGFIVAEFDLTLDPGQTQSLMFFIAARNQTDTFDHTPTRAETLADVTAMLNDPALQFSGLSSAEQSTVVNFVPEPTSMALLAITGLLLARRR